MNLPLDKLKRDEIYTFICGLLVGLAWHLHFQQIRWVAPNTGVFDPSLILAWLLSTGIVYLFGMILQPGMDWQIKRKIAAHDEESELKRLQATKYMTFYWAGHLEEQRLILHIATLLSVALPLVYYPLFAFISPRITGWTSPTESTIYLLAGSALYFVLWITALLTFYLRNYYLYLINHFINKGYFDTLDQAEYIRDRARLYADVQHRFYLGHLFPPEPLNVRSVQNIARGGF